jgi:tRNA pseudouridine55 synthase
VDGALNIDKPAGVTSHDVVNKVRRILQTKKVGHAGTLDPMATGVLLVCVGQATRIAEFLMGAEKEYEGVMTLGATTDTEDSSGRVEREADASSVTEDQVAQVLPKFLGEISQVPPMVSAVHHEGKRLYELARQGKVVDREPKLVSVRRIEMLSFEPGDRPKVTLRVVCSKGLYIRTLFADFGEALGVGAHMSGLRRTRIGRFVIADAINLDTLAAMAESGGLEQVVIPMAEALAEFPGVAVSEESAADVKYGRTLPMLEEPAPPEASTVRLMRGNCLIALAKVVRLADQVVLQPDKVFI